MTNNVVKLDLRFKKCIVSFAFSLLGVVGVLSASPYAPSLSMAVLT